MRAVLTPDPLGHVIGIGNAKKPIEALTCGKEIGLVAEMPFPDDSCRVAVFFQGFGDGFFVGI